MNRRRQPFQGCALPPELPGHPGRISRKAKLVRRRIPCHAETAQAPATPKTTSGPDRIDLRLRNYSNRLPNPQRVFQLLLDTTQFKRATGPLLVAAHLRANQCARTVGAESRAHNSLTVPPHPCAAQATPKVAATVASSDRCNSSSARAIALKCALPTAPCASQRTLGPHRADAHRSTNWLPPRLPRS